MIKMICDPILGVRYITGYEPYTENTPGMSLRAQALYNITRDARVKQIQRANNTKSK